MVVVEAMHYPMYEVHELLRILADLKAIYLFGFHTVKYHRVEQLMYAQEIILNAMPDICDWKQLLILRYLKYYNTSYGSLSANNLGRTASETRRNSLSNI